MRVFLISIVTALTILDSCQVLSQSKGIQFRPLSWEQALEAAKKENKFLFVDVHSTLGNMGLQNELENGIFKTDSISDFFNSNFISVKVDMSTKENNSFAPKLQSLMYPVYVFLAENGDQIGFVSPYAVTKDPSKLVRSAGEAINRGIIKRKNTKRIEFEELIWEEAKTKAEKENKLIFFDAHTDWCRPCIQMDKDIFTLDEVADFFNENFINLKTNSEKGEGVAIRQEYEIRAYPTFLFTDAEGNLVLEESGYKEKDKFLAIAKEAVSKYQYASIDFIIQDLDQARAKAKQENKPILFDAYTTWCGPCKQMDKQVFTQHKVAKFYNDEFVNLKVDMEKGEGVSLKTKYEVTAYPTYLVLDKDGNVLHRAVGGMSAEEFVRFGEAGKSESNLSGMMKRYESGERNTDFVLEYIKTLSGAYLTSETNNVADTYFIELSEGEKLSEQTWTFIEDYIVSPDSRAIKYIVENREKFTTSFGDKVEKKLFNVYLGGASQFAELNEKRELVSYDQEGFEKYLKEVKKLSLTKYDQLVAYAWIGSYRTRNDWNRYVSAVDKYMNKETIDKGVYSVYNYALVVERNAKDEGLRKTASDWITASESTAPDYYKDPLSKLKKKLSGPLTEN